MRPSPLPSVPPLQAMFFVLSGRCSLERNASYEQDAPEPSKECLPDGGANQVVVANPALPMLPQHDIIRKTVLFDQFLQNKSLLSGN